MHPTLVVDGFPSVGSEPIAIEHRVGARIYSAYLRSYPPTGQIDVTPTLIDHLDGQRTTLGRVLTDAGFAPRAHVSLNVLGGSLATVLELAIPSP